MHRKVSERASEVAGGRREEEAITAGGDTCRGGAGKGREGGRIGVNQVRRKAGAMERGREDERGTRVRLALFVGGSGWLLACLARLLLSLIELSATCLGPSSSSPWQTTLHPTTTYPHSVISILCRAPLPSSCSRPHPVPALPPPYASLPLLPISCLPSCTPRPPPPVFSPHPMLCPPLSFTPKQLVCLFPP